MWNNTGTSVDPGKYVVTFSFVNLYKWRKPDAKHLSFSERTVANTFIMCRYNLGVCVFFLTCVGQT